MNRPTLYNEHHNITILTLKQGNLFYLIINLFIRNINK